MKLSTPGVYIEEIPLLAPSVAEVETAIPAFIGYTQSAIKDGVPIKEPFRITSLIEYEKYFGKAPEITVAADVKVSEEPLVVKEKNDDPAKIKYENHTGYKIEAVPKVANAGKPLSYNILYYAVQMFFDNGGGPCYIVSIGEALGNAPNVDHFKNGLDQIRNFDEPTLLVAPEASFLSAGDYKAFYQLMIKQAVELKDRFVIIDTIYNSKPDIGKDQEAFRNAETGISGNKEELRYAAAYYPWINTSVKYLYKIDDMSFIDSKILQNDALTDLKGLVSTIKETNDDLYQQVKAGLEKSLRVPLPPSSTIAGVYANVDNQRGVWKAPANVVLKSVSSTVIQISAEQQGQLNIDSTGGKSINAIRTLSGKGITVWGARTMDGNDREWRYVNVRRFFNMVEESVQKSTIWAVFEPNTKNTWVKVKSMIESYLLSKWIEGALAGSKPEEAFFVKVGLPETMSSDEVLDGIMRVKIGMAVSRPAEFIILQFTHKQQTS